MMACGEEYRHSLMSVLPHRRRRGFKASAEEGDRSNRPMMKPASGNGIRCREFVWALFAESIWASGLALRQQVGHMTAFDPAPLFHCLDLETNGPSTRDLLSKRTKVDAAAAAGAVDLNFVHWILKFRQCYILPRFTARTCCPKLR